eukprot:15454317-Alexandrium_andersonii.AAC.1
MPLCLRAALRAGGGDFARWPPAEATGEKAGDPPYFSIMQCGSYVGVGIGVKTEGASVLLALPASWTP